MAHHLEKLQCAFLWGGYGPYGEEIQMHLVNWKSVCLPLQSSDLGIQNLLWRIVIASKYGNDGVVGALEFQINLMGFLCGSTLKVVGEDFLKISYSRWEGVFKSVFGTICGVRS